MCGVLRARYDPATDRWLMAAPMISRRFALGAAALDNCIYAVRCSLSYSCSCTGQAASISFTNATILWLCS